MKIEVMNRREATRLCYKPAGGRKISMISIFTPGDEYQAGPGVRGGVKELLSVGFCDVSEDSSETPAITQEDAHKIAQFILYRVSKGCDDFVIHCDAGMSRSAGVARAMELFYDLPESAVTYRHGNFSNSLVFRKVFHSLMEQSGRTQ